jgi:hypothetical protein
MVKNLFPMPATVVSFLHLKASSSFLPLYLIVAKFNPTKFGRRKVFFSVSHVPSPTCSVFEEYELLPGGASCGDGDMAVLDAQCGTPARENVGF